MLESIPISTYRIQFNHLFTFQDAIKLVDYWYALGITTIYASPLTKARSKSLYGYDVVDHNQINPEIGTQQEFIQFATTLKNKGMSLLLDIVPNHMCISDSENFWWKDVLENGPSSIYANYFDILWDSPKTELKNKVFLPVLSQQIGQVIEDQEIKFFYRNGAFYLDYKGLNLPVNPNSWMSILQTLDKQRLKSLNENDENLLEFESILSALENLPSNSVQNEADCLEHHREKIVIQKRLNQLFEAQPFFQNLLQKALVKLNGVKDQPESFNALESLLKEQAYRLSYWRLSNDLINYRRFFDINDLACLHVENKKVFDAIHSLVIRLVNEGWLSGLRIDHIDGLYEPEEYLKHLRYQNASTKKLYIIVEKILVGNEELSQNWPIEGTSGYDYLNVLNGLFINPEAKDAIQTTYENFMGYPNQLKKNLYKCKKHILSHSMASELTTLARRLEIISEQNRWSYDFAYESLRAALRDIVASFSVYRSYIKLNDQSVSTHDQKVIFKAVEQAKSLNPLRDHLVFDFIKNVLLLIDPPGLNEEQIKRRREFVLRFQQLTGPVMAKGVEDTALYRSYALSSNNEVGMDPAQFGTTIDEFHLVNLERQKKWPHTLSATSTHDTKRGEDVRSRINSLTEIPQQWEHTLQSWQLINEDKKVSVNSLIIPDANEEYLLYQTLIGTWPASFDNEEAKNIYLQRIQNYMNKALKEAKIHTSWINPNIEYEEAVNTFVKRILNPKQSFSFLTDLEEFVKPIQKAGKWTSLSQMLLKMTAPGIPDFYQGTEFFEYTLVDPDNRGSIDFKKRQDLLAFSLQYPEKDLTHVLKEWPENLDNFLKIFLMQRVLNFRKKQKDLFAKGEYAPLKVSGEKASQVIGFKRTFEHKECIVIVSRFYLSLIGKEDELIPNHIWTNTQIDFSHSLLGLWTDILSNEAFNFANSSLVSLDQLFKHLPFVILTNTF